MNRLFKLAVKCNSKTLVAHYIKKRFEINDLDSSGMSLLMYAAAKNYTEICSMLLNAGADPLVQSKSGQMATTIAQQAGATEAAALILNHIQLNACDDPSVPVARLDTATTSEQHPTEAESAEHFNSILTRSDDRLVCHETFTEPDELGGGSTHQPDLVPATSVSSLSNLGSHLSPNPTGAEPVDSSENVEFLSNSHAIGTSLRNEKLNTLYSDAAPSTFETNNAFGLPSVKNMATESWIQVERIHSTESRSFHGTDDESDTESLSIINRIQIHAKKIADAPLGNGWEALPEPVTPNFQTNSIHSYCRIQSAVSRHVPKDLSTEWQITPDNPSRTNEQRIDLDMCDDLDDLTMLIFYTGRCNGRLFRNQLDMLHVSDDEEALNHTGLVEFVCGQAGIIIDESEPTLTGTYEDRIRDDVDLTGQDWEDTVEMGNFFMELANSCDDPVDFIQTQVYGSKRLQRNEGPALSRLLEEGYRQVLEAVVSSSFLMAVLRERINSSDDGACDDETAYQEDYPVDDFAPGDSFQGDKDQNDLYSSVSLTEIIKIIDDYSPLATRFAKPISSNKTQANSHSSKTIVERIYEAGISFGQLNELYLVFRDFMNRLEGTLTKVTGILVSLTGISPDVWRMRLTGIDASELCRTVETIFPNGDIQDRTDHYELFRKLYECNFPNYSDRKGVIFS